MGKHNGKARKSGLTVGSALVNKARREGRTGGAAAFLHTTDLEGPKKNMQSVIESNDLDEMMAMVSRGRCFFSAAVLVSHYACMLSPGAKAPVHVAGASPPWCWFGRCKCG